MTHPQVWQRQWLLEQDALTKSSSRTTGIDAAAAKALKAKQAAAAKAGGAAGGAAGGDTAAAAAAAAAAAPHPPPMLDLLDYLPDTGQCWLYLSVCVCVCWLSDPTRCAHAHAARLPRAAHTPSLKSLTQSINHVTLVDHSRVAHHTPHTTTHREHAGLLVAVHEPALHRGRGLPGVCVCVSAFVDGSRVCGRVRSRTRCVCMRVPPPHSHSLLPH
jgi:hypothetical protein